MKLTASLVLLLIAVVCFVIEAFKWDSRHSWMNFGFAAITASWIIA